MQVKLKLKVSVSKQPYYRPREMAFCSIILKYGKTEFLVKLKTLDSLMTLHLINYNHNYNISIC